MAPWGLSVGAPGALTFFAPTSTRGRVMASPGSGHRHPPGAVRPRGGGCSGQGDQKLSPAGAARAPPGAAGRGAAAGPLHCAGGGAD